MKRKQLIAIGALPVLTVTMVGVYRLLLRRLGAGRAWYAGFLVYWPVWRILFPLQVLGFKKLRSLFQHRRPNALGWFIVILPPVLAFLGRFAQDRPTRGVKERAALVSTAFMNGTLEEVLWRGVYVGLFPDKPLWAVVWPTLWFALWHYAPGSVSPLTDVGTLMVGAGMLGACLSWLTLQTRSILWAAISHTLAGLAQALS